jgi:hypothetical protein
MTRGHRGSLDLRCRALSSPSPCRFIPTLSTRPAIPLACGRPDGTGRPWAFPRASHPADQEPTTHVEAGTGHRARAWNYALNITPVDPPNRVVHSQRATSRRTTTSRSAARYFCSARGRSGRREAPGLRGTCWPDWPGFLPPPLRSVHAVLPHTAHRRSSPPAFSFP